MGHHLTCVGPYQCCNARNNKGSSKLALAIRKCFQLYGSSLLQSPDFGQGLCGRRERPGSNVK